MFKCEVSCEVICDVVGVPSWQGSTYWTDLEQDRDIFCLICVLKKRSNVFYSKVWMLYIMCSNKWSEISYCSYWLNGSTSRGLLYNIVVLLQHRLTQNGCPHYPQCNLTWEAIYKLGTATSRCFNKKKRYYLPRTCKQTFIYKISSYQLMTNEGTNMLFINWELEWKRLRCTTWSLFAL